MLSCRLELNLRNKNNHKQNSQKQVKLYLVEDSMLKEEKYSSVLSHLKKKRFAEILNTLSFTDEETEVQTR